MSCVDAAIIKALVEHVGMDPEDVELGGHQCVEYTAGDAIALEDNQIHVKFNADMFEINDNELCLKSGSGGSGSRKYTKYTGNLRFYTNNSSYAEEVLCVELDDKSILKPGTIIKLVDKYGVIQTSIVLDIRKQDSGDAHLSCVIYEPFEDRIRWTSTTSNYFVAGPTKYYPIDSTNNAEVGIYLLEGELDVFESLMLKHIATNTIELRNVRIAAEEALNRLNALQ
jgi:hypothetical protein